MFWEKARKSPLYVRAQSRGAEPFPFLVLAVPASVCSNQSALPRDCEEDTENENTDVFLRSVFFFLSLIWGLVFPSQRVLAELLKRCCQTCAPKSRDAVGRRRGGQGRLLPSGSCVSEQACWEREFFPLSFPSAMPSCAEAGSACCLSLQTVSWGAHKSCAGQGGLVPGFGGAEGSSMPPWAPEALETCL